MIYFLSDCLSDKINMWLSGSASMQRLPLPACLLTEPSWVLLKHAEKVRQLAHAHRRTRAHPANAHSSKTSVRTERNVTELIAANSTGLEECWRACVRARVFCLADRQSQCSDTDYRVPVTSYYSACAFGYAPVVATCLSVSAGTCLTS